MKPSIGTYIWSTLALLLSLAGDLVASPLGSAFTYQGRLNDGANPANGFYDLQFAVFDASTGGSQLGSTLTSAATAVSNGLFTVTLDFGAGVFTGASRWLAIGVRTNGSGSFVPAEPAATPPACAVCHHGQQRQQSARHPARDQLERRRSPGAIARRRPDE